jgi:hypothetical protein
VQILIAAAAKALYKEAMKVTFMCRPWIFENDGKEAKKVK